MLLPPTIYVSPLHTAVRTKISIIDAPIIWFSNNPFENEIDIVIDGNSNHPTPGLNIRMYDKMDHVKFLACDKGTPAGHIPK